MDWPALAVKRPFCMSPDAALPLFDATQLILLNGMVALPQPPDWQESAVDESTTRVTGRATAVPSAGRVGDTDRKSTRLNSSHLVISYAVFCLKKKKTIICPRSH